MPPATSERGGNICTGPRLHRVQIWGICTRYLNRYKCSTTFVLDGLYWLDTPYKCGLPTDTNALFSTSDGRPATTSACYCRRSLWDVGSLLNTIVALSESDTGSDLPTSILPRCGFHGPRLRSDGMCWVGRAREGEAILLHTSLSTKCDALTSPSARVAWPSCHSSLISTSCWAQILNEQYVKNWLW
jgi:hypothetical protein